MSVASTSRGGGCSTLCAISYGTAFSANFIDRCDAPLLANLRTYANLRQKLCEHARGHAPHPYIHL